MKKFSKLVVYWDEPSLPAAYAGRWKADVYCAEQDVNWILHGFGSTIVDAVSDAWRGYESANWEDFGSVAHTPFPSI